MSTARTITFQELADAIEVATIELQINVPSTDYYARAGDFDVRHISIIDPHTLLTLLRGDS